MQPARKASLPQTETPTLPVALTPSANVRSVRWWMPTENAQPEPEGRGNHNQRPLSRFDQRDRSHQQQRLVDGARVIANRGGEVARADKQTPRARPKSDHASRRRSSRLRATGSST
jgi:hypothetical protein